jgi:putative aldouronate transport system substrate-binding protein
VLQFGNSCVEVLNLESDCTLRQPVSVVRFERTFERTSTVPFHYLTRGPAAFYWPQTPQNTPIMHDTQSAIYPYISLDPTIGYYSPANAAKLPALTRDKVNDILAGRQPLDAIDQLIKDWRANGGDQIRMEFQQAMS